MAHVDTVSLAEETTPRPVVRQTGVAAWAGQLGSPGAEGTWSRRLAHLGGLAAITALIAYLGWRIGFTFPDDTSDRVFAYLLVTFEAFPVIGLAVRTVSLWNIDSPGAPVPVTQAPHGQRVAVLIPTYNEPAEIIAPTIAASCALQPAHETWVLDDGDRNWLAELCAAMGARYVSRPVHEAAKAGNLNHALALMAAEEAAGADAIDIVAVLDCDHVPLPSFLSTTLVWFADPEVALVQAPQAFYNGGAFDDDGLSGEQGLFYTVQMPALFHAGGAPLWCGSTSLLRVSALRQVGGVATETITEDMHTGLKLIRAGWKTVYHHQTLAVGLAPSTPDQYLLQRRRRGLGATQILTTEGILAAKRWMSWRSFRAYLSHTLWWVEGVATLVAFLIPIVVLLSGAHTSTADPATLALAFTAMMAIRLAGLKLLVRRQIQWRTALALRILRVPVGIACLRWLVARRPLEFEVVPKGASHLRRRGQVPRILWGLTVLVSVVLVYAVAGVLHLVPWRADLSSTIAAGVWPLLAAGVLLLGAHRIRAAEYATSRRVAPRTKLATPASVNGVPVELLDISVGGAAIRFPYESELPLAALVQLELPQGPAVRMLMQQAPSRSGEMVVASMRALMYDWKAYRSMALWMFHTPPDAVPFLPAGVPAVAARPGQRARR